MTEAEYQAQKVRRAQEIYDHSYHKLLVKTDRIFAGLFVFQWLLGIALALWISPRAWAGGESQVHIHVYAAALLGGLIAFLPVALALLRPGHALNRYVVATAQIAFSILFIHLTGGRIETHFHVFGSLAFLSFYRDIRPVLLATLITAADHLLRGLYWPESVYGVLSATPLRALEHAAWVIFEDIFLIIAVREGQRELCLIARQQAEVELTLAGVEKTVERRTQELRRSQETIIGQQQALVSSAKMSALGEMAGGIAHEINNPLAIIAIRVEQIQECIKDGDVSAPDVQNSLGVILKTTQRISKIINGLRFFARDVKHAPMQKTGIGDLVNETLSLCHERFSTHGVQLEVRKGAVYEQLTIECRAVEISQVLLNLLNNSYDAIQNSKDKWVRVEAAERGEYAEITVTDSGSGIPKEIQEKMMQPFFTTKDVGKGTGLGLSISRGIVEAHQGKLYLDTDSPNTRFVLLLPKAQNPSTSVKEAA